MYLAAKLPERTGSYNKRLFGDLSDAVMVWEPATGSYDSVQSSQKWQHGTAMPTIDNLVILATVFGCRIDDIIVVDRIEIRKTA